MTTRFEAVTYRSGESTNAMKRTRLPLVPRRPILLVEESKISWLTPSEVTNTRVGHKAVGLASIPSEWTKPFFCVCGKSPPNSEALAQAISDAGIREDARLLVRSSGVTESIDSRGELESAECSRSRLLDELTRLRDIHSPGAEVHWVVQELIECAAKGHLSNERRIAQAKRDWVAEVEAASSHSADTYRIRLRTWRDQRPPKEVILNCAHKESNVDCLRIVARWAYERLIRVHFEWVWDGRTMYIVQADTCDENSHGVDPKSLVRAHAAGSSMPLQLEVFRAATVEDFAKYRKLANAKTYRDLGYQIVPFFVMDDASAIQSVVKEGRCSDAMRRDLAVLTTRPLVIRTDGHETPSQLREMLPRSEELRSANAAEDWLVGEFQKKVQARTAEGLCLADSSLCLLAHHFLPAAASAWCQALPNQRRVRIESLWGIPEGLYWYAYDVFDVDTQVPIEARIGTRPSNFTVREKCRYKEHFIAPNEDGAWVVHRTSSKADWARSVTKAEWIQEIAWTSRCIATREGRPVVVMWLIDTPLNSTPHRVMPWYHGEWKQEGLIQKATPRKKFASSIEVLLQTRSDWNSLQVDLEQGKHVARIRVDPREPEMVRDQVFVNGLADLAKKHNIVIELSGGILSHAYYMLSEAGCAVECADLDDFAVDDEAIEFNKLVRDGIPQAIVSRGESVELLRVRGEALVAALRRKLVEETFEVLDAKTNDQIAEELADVREVSLSIMAELGISEASVETARRQKFKKRGGFAAGIMLGKTAVSSPLVSRAAQNALPIADAEQVPASTLMRSIELPSTASEDIHIDLRHDSEGVPERQLTATIPAHAAGFVPPRVVFDLETQDGHSHEMIVAVEVDRHSADLRIRICLKNAPQQLRLDFE
jgi:predicted house-cleaning noncanonical NTP pyrophosphatase (MazG superfamily)